ncbi:MAG: hypothetical protein Q8P72_05990 [Candidatus Roizmanbacteria bacterium]|nr:hypothetical protein [Candidatus Roizmanbacteria bacterium]
MKYRNLQYIRGEISTLIVVGMLVIAGVGVLMSSSLGQNKNTTNTRAASESCPLLGKPELISGGKCQVATNASTTLVCALIDTSKNPGEQLVAGQDIPNQPPPAQGTLSWTIFNGIGIVQLHKDPSITINEGTQYRVVVYNWKDTTGCVKETDVIGSKVICLFAGNNSCDGDSEGGTNPTNTPVPTGTQQPAPTNTPVPRGGQPTSTPPTATPVPPTPSPQRNVTLAVNTSDTQCYRTQSGFCMNLTIKADAEDECINFSSSWKIQNTKYGCEYFCCAPIISATQPEWSPTPKPGQCASPEVWCATLNRCAGRTACPTGTSQPNSRDNNNNSSEKVSGSFQTTKDKTTKAEVVNTSFGTGIVIGG